ncbi:polysaccharide deacetylase family protein [Marinobacter sp. GN3S48]|uniref:polysaccharide deacetylase family protein n=1 Tax=Marinobacter sp. GN3S48 TaxID=3382302 RepID=UPI00387ACE3D
MTFNQLIYKGSRPFGGFRLAKLMSRRHPKILMYHRISSDPNAEGLTADQFRLQVDIIKREFLPMTLRDLLSAHESREVPDNAVVVTFDDGYADFAEVAFPILQAAGVPATLFVTTGFVNGDIWLWPDQIRYAISHAGTEQLTLPPFNQSFNVKVDPFESWNTIADHCLTTSNEEKLALIDELYKQLKVTKPVTAPDNFRAVSWKQIKQMIGDGLDIGSHSISHPILTKLNDEQLSNELQRSRQKIEAETGMSVDVFCYPNGREVDFDQRVKECIHQCGYRYAVSAFPAKRPIDDNWCINRYPIGRRLDLFEKNLFGFSYLAMT